jgi:pimeloyl-ACP methyl ester carboxylesterase
VDVPTLVIHGDADAVSDVEGSERLVERLPRGELVVIEGAGHVPMVTRPDEVEAAIEDFIAGQVG